LHAFCEFLTVRGITRCIDETVEATLAAYREVDHANEVIAAGRLDETTRRVSTGKRAPPLRW